MKRIAIGLAMGIVLAACTSAPEPAPAINTTGIKTFSLQAHNAAGESVWDGTIEAVQQATLTAQTAGRVTAVLVDINDRVTADTLLIQLSAVEQNAGANTANAEVALAKAQALAAENSYRRYADLAAKQYISKQQLDQALAARNSARAQVSAAQAQAIQVGQQSNYTRIHAPFDGIISNRFIEPGESISVGKELISIFNPEKLRIEVQVPQSTAEALRVNPKAVVELADGERIQSNDVLVFPSADGNSHSVKVRVLLPTKMAKLKPGQVAKVIFDVPTSQAALLIPKSALWQRGELSTVYVVTDKNIFLRQVRSGETRGESIELISGVNSGERIALMPAQAAELLVQFKAKAAPAND
jgi:RND family efflux transporter MFP subunit